MSTDGEGRWSRCGGASGHRESLAGGSHGSCRRRARSDCAHRIARALIVCAGFGPRRSLPSLAPRDDANRRRGSRRVVGSGWLRDRRAVASDEGRLAGTFSIERQQPTENRILLRRRRVGIVPAVGGPDGAVECGVEVHQPGRAGVWAGGQRPPRPGTIARPSGLCAMGLRAPASGCAITRQARSLSGRPCRALANPNAHAAHGRSYPVVGRGRGRRSIPPVRPASTRETLRRGRAAPPVAASRGRC